MSNIKNEEYWVVAGGTSKRFIIVLCVRNPKFQYKKRRILGGWGGTRKCFIIVLCITNPYFPV